MAGLHHVTTAAGRLAYNAAWMSLPIPGLGGRAVSATSYIAENQIGDDRPLMFLWNGGPGASSSPLHLSAFGPRRFAATPGHLVGITTEPRMIEENPATLLDVADLVFVDPVGTGMQTDVDDPPELTVELDGAAVEAFVRHWINAHGRKRSPLHLVGESFGAFRLTEMSERLADLDVRGLILISPMLDPAIQAPSVGNDQSHIADVPAMSVAAWRHGRSKIRSNDVDEVWRAARDFAEGDYLVALQKGVAVEPAKERAVAERLHLLTGVPIDRIIKSRLRLSSEEFLRELLYDEDRIVGRLDTRITGPLPAPVVDGGRPPSADDPALGVGRSNIILSPDIKHYLRQHAGADGAGDYVALTLALNFAWDWRPASKKAEFSRNYLPRVAVLLDERPAAQMLVIGGIYDMATVWGGVVYSMMHAGISADRFTLLMTHGGHSLTGEALDRAGEAIRRFVTTDIT